MRRLALLGIVLVLPLVAADQPLYAAEEDITPAASAIRFFTVPAGTSEVEATFRFDGPAYEADVQLRGSGSSAGCLLYWVAGVGYNYCIARISFLQPSAQDERWYVAYTARGVATMDIVVVGR